MCERFNQTLKLEDNLHTESVIFQAFHPLCVIVTEVNIQFVLFPYKTRSGHKAVNALSLGIFNLWSEPFDIYPVVNPTVLRLLFTLCSPELQSNVESLNVPDNVNPVAKTSITRVFTIQFTLQVNTFPNSS